jgi:hypothetical protein
MRFHSTRLAACALVAALGVVLPAAATATAAPTALSSSSEVAGAADPDDWSYLMAGEESRWNPCARIGYRLNLANAPRGTVAEVKSAFRRVHAESGLRFVYRGATSILPGAQRPRAYGSGTDIVLAWSTPRKSSYLPDGAAAFAGASAYDAAGPDGEQVWGLQDGYGVFNQGIYRQMAPGFSQGPEFGYQGTRGQLLMHELGHVVGLGHAEHVKQIMFPSMSRKTATWRAGDVTGLSMVGATRGCVRAATTSAMAVQQSQPTTTLGLR